MVKRSEPTHSSIGDYRIIREKRRDGDGLVDVFRAQRKGWFGIWNNISSWVATEPRAEANILRDREERNYRTNRSVRLISPHDPLPDGQEILNSRRPPPPRPSKFSGKPPAKE